MNSTSSNETKESESLSDIINEYINSLPDKERVGYEIAKQHLGTSFTVEKTVGFLRWKKQKLEST
jgi:hypothetical protein